MILHRLLLVPPAAPEQHPIHLQVLPFARCQEALGQRGGRRRGKLAVMSMFHAMRSHTSVAVAVAVAPC